MQINLPGVCNDDDDLCTLDDCEAGTCKETAVDCSNLNTECETGAFTLFCSKVSLEGEVCSSRYLHSSDNVFLTQLGCCAQVSAVMESAAPRTNLLLRHASLPKSSSAT